MSFLPLLVLIKTPPLELLCLEKDDEASLGWMGGVNSYQGCGQRCSSEPVAKPDTANRQRRIQPTATRQEPHAPAPRRWATSPERGRTRGKTPRRPAETRSAEADRQCAATTAHGILR